MTESSNTQHKVEVNQPKGIQGTPVSVDHTETGREVLFNCPKCGQQHAFNAPWHFGPGTGHGAWQLPHCPSSNQTHSDAVVEVVYPPGYETYWHQGNAKPGARYPGHNGIVEQRFALSDAQQNGNPTGGHLCPTGCVRDHTGTPEEHYHSGPVWTQASGQDVGDRPKFYFRTQQHHNSDPRSPFSYVELEVFDAEFNTWNTLLILLDDAQRLANMLQAHVTGKAHLNTKPSIEEIE